MACKTSLIMPLNINLMLSRLLAQCITKVSSWLWPNNQPKQCKERGTYLCSKFWVESPPWWQRHGSRSSLKPNSWDTDSSSPAATYIKARKLVRQKQKWAGVLRGSSLATTSQWFHRLSRRVPPAGNKGLALRAGEWMTLQVTDLPATYFNGYPVSVLGLSTKLF